MTCNVSPRDIIEAKVVFRVNGLAAFIYETVHTSVMCLSYVINLSCVPTILAFVAYVSCVKSASFTFNK